MLCTMRGRDEQGYPLLGEDVVPEKRSPSPPKDDTVSNLVQLLQASNAREDRLKETVAQWNRKYHDLYQEHIALKFGDFCEMCQTKQDTTEPGGCVELCAKCGEGKITIRGLQLRLEKKQEEVRYWQDCYETALSQLTDFPEKQL